MPQTCIITDNTTQFTQSGFSGQSYVKVLPLVTNTDDRGELFRDNTLRRTPSECNPIPGVDLISINSQNVNYIETILTISQEYHQLLFILPARTLSPAIIKIETLLNQITIPADVEIIDTQTISLGVGWLVQVCAREIAAGKNLSQIKYYLINKIPHIYTLIYIYDLLNLKELGLLDADQALVGNLLGIHPLILLEKGHILPYQKIRTIKSFGDVIQNYANEFEQIQFIGITYGSDIGVADKKNLNYRVQSSFPKVKTEFQLMNKTMDNILGPQSIGVVLIDKG